MDLTRPLTIAPTDGRKAGVWDRLMDAVTKAHDGKVQMIDSSIVREHQHAYGVRKSGVRCVGRSRTSSARRSRASSRFCSPPAGKPHQPRADGGRQARRTGDIEAQLDGGRNLVDVLPAGSRGTYELLAELRLRAYRCCSSRAADASAVSSVAPEPYSASHASPAPHISVSPWPCRQAAVMPAPPVRQRLGNAGSPFPGLRPASSAGAPSSSHCSALKYRTVEPMPRTCVLVQNWGYGVSRVRSPLFGDDS